MIDWTIRKAIDFWEKEHKKKLDLWDHPDSFAMAINELQDSIAWWCTYATHILTPTNWDFSRLLTKDGTIRLPKAYLAIELTEKGNIVLDWYPDRPAAHYGYKTSMISFVKGKTEISP
jgi:hypothetical protein